MSGPSHRPKGQKSHPARTTPAVSRKTQLAPGRTGSSSGQWPDWHSPEWSAALLALTGYKVLVITGGVVFTWLGFRLWPRVFIVLMGLCELLVVAAVANNVFWLVRR